MRGVFRDNLFTHSTSKQVERENRTPLLFIKFSKERSLNMLRTLVFAIAFSLLMAGYVDGQWVCIPDQIEV